VLVIGEKTPGIDALIEALGRKGVFPSLLSGSERAGSYRNVDLVLAFGKEIPRDIDLPPTAVRVLVERSEEDPVDLDVVDVGPANVLAVGIDKVAAALLEACC
jgi:hypothetical protein